MRGRVRPVVALILILEAAGCGPPVPPAREPLQGVFNNVPVPAGIKVVRYHATIGGMDPSFNWILEPVDQAYLNALIKANALATATPAKGPAEVSSPGQLGWWDETAIRKLPEAYYDDTGAGGMRRIWVDRGANRMYVEFSGY